MKRYDLFIFIVEKIGTSVTVLLGYLFLQTMIADMMPKSDTFPLICGFSLSKFFYKYYKNTGT